MKTPTNKIIASIVSVAVHTFAVLVISALTAWMVLDTQSIQSYVEAISGNVVALDWAGLALHVGLAACFWAMIVIMFKLVTDKETKRHRRVLKKSIGTVATETLIIIPPFLLLTSGMSQLTMLNIAGMLSDYAAFQGARAVMLWQPEEQINRFPVSSSCDMNADNSTCTRARTAVAFALAPSAPSNFQLSFSQPNPSAQSFKRARGVMVAGFSGGTGASGYGKGNRAITFNRGQRGSMRNVTYTEAFDTHRFSVRAARKASNAYMSLDTFSITRGGNVGVDFTYKYQLVFPWFGAIFGKRAGTGTYYSPIRRTYSLPAQPNMK